jgi:GDP-4-dehydro-6-deoxy-D-mannose reductase
MTLLVTGASGFVGRHLQRTIACETLDGAGPPLDLRDAGQVRAAVARVRPTRVIHLAAQSFVPVSFEDPLETFAVNFTGTWHLLQALAGSGFTGRLLYVGSGDMYGRVPPERLPIAEEEPLRPRSPYAVSKVAGEALCYQWSQTGPFEIVMTRSFNHIGPGQARRFAVSDFAAQVAEIRRGRREPVLRVGDIDVTRDFSDVRDVVRAYLLLLEHGGNGEVYNVCSGIERTLRDILGALLALAGVEARIAVEPERRRPNEQRRLCGSNARLRRDTPWRPAVAWETTLSDLLTDWEERLNG